MSDLPLSIRTPHAYYELVRSSFWGSGYVQAPDPLATHEKAPDYTVAQGFDRIPAYLIEALVSLYSYVGSVCKSEVSVRLLKKEDDLSQWKIIVPAQYVDMSSVSVPDFNSAVDLITGEPIAYYPPEGWVDAGSSHVHPFAMSTFSLTDDQSELPSPGLHFIVYFPSPGKWDITASIVQRRTRFIVDAKEVVEFPTKVAAGKYSPLVLNQLKKRAYARPKQVKPGQVNPTVAKLAQKYVKPTRPVKPVYEEDYDLFGTSLRGDGQVDLAYLAKLLRPLQLNVEQLKTLVALAVVDAEFYHLPELVEELMVFGMSAESIVNGLIEEDV